MGGQTHKQYSILFACITLIIMFNIGVSSINYFLTIPIVMAISKSGALFPDIDHAWVNVANKTVINKILNTVIRKTGGKHRSRHTHSADICLAFTLIWYIIPTYLYNIGLLSSVNKEVAILLVLSFSSGWVSHLFSDMLTTDGIYILVICKKRLSIVPKKIGKLRFNTGGDWEKFNYKFIKATNKVAGTICVLYPIIINLVIPKIRQLIM